MWPSAAVFGRTPGASANLRRSRGCPPCVAMPTIYAVWCPRGFECSKGGKLLAKGPCEVNVNDRLLQHLMNAPGHARLTEAEAKDIAYGAELTAWDKEYDQEGEEEQVPIGAKRRRIEASHSAPSLDQDALTDVAAAVALGIQEGVATSLQMTGRETLLKAKHPGAPPPLRLEEAAVVSSTATSSTGMEYVSLPRTVVQTMMDHLTRAEHAARTAGRISSTAANAFDAEANSIAATRGHLEAFLARRF